MVSIALSVLAVSSIGAGLALVLVVAERFITNYGECEIEINGEKKLRIEGGKSVLSSLAEEKVFVPSACGGRGTCGMCKLKVIKGGGNVLATETPFLTKDEIEDNVRLSCQVKIRNDIRIEIPEELFSVREFECKCTEIRELTHDIRQFRFELIEPAEIDFVPGQYIQLFAPIYKKGGEEVYRAYSISSDPMERNVVETLIRLVPGGICTTYCFDYLEEGAQVKFNGPYGDFCLSDTDAPMVFIAGGSGMAPIKSLLHHMKNMSSKRKAVYYFGANNVSEMFMLEEMEQFEKELEGFKFVPVIASLESNIVWDGETGLVTDAVRRGVTDASKSEAYLCGSPGMIDASIAVLTEMGMPEDNIFYDKFA